jgi:hypothetical protein
VMRPFHSDFGDLTLRIRPVICLLSRRRFTRRESSRAQPETQPWKLGTRVNVIVKSEK